MRINHNLSSMTAQNSMFRVNRDMSKSLQKLSTGLRINTASDDAAGLGVSENLRTQVRGMQMAFRNTQDAISMLQIADGALNEQADVLQRMRELVIQAKNDTYTQTERGYMYQEFEGLMGELDRIAAVTNYNGMSIFCAPEMQSGVDGQGVLGSDSYATAPHAAVDGRDIWDDPADSIFGANDFSSSHHFNMMLGANYSNEDSTSFNSATESFDQSAQNLITIQFGQMDANSLLSKSPSLAMGNASETFDDFDWDSTNFLSDREDFWLSIVYEGAPGLGTVQTKLDYLLNLIDGNDSNIASHPLIRSAGTQNPTGLQRINHMRSNIGAMVNRLEHSSNNLLNQISNTQSAESMIRDADFALETSKFSKNQVLTQSSTAMLAQGNMLPQAVLQLLG